MDPDSMCLPLTEKELEDCIPPEMKTEWEELRSKDCSNSLFAGASGNFFPRMQFDKHKKPDSGSLGFPKSSDVQRCFAASETFCCYDVASNSVARASNVCENTAPMVPWTSTAASSMKKVILRQQKEVSTQSHCCHV